MIYYVSQLFSTRPEDDTVILTTDDENAAALMVAECYMDLFLTTNADLRKPFSQLVEEYSKNPNYPRYEVFAEASASGTDPINELGIEAIKTIVHAFHHVVDPGKPIERPTALTMLPSTLKRAQRIVQALSKQDLIDIWQLLNAEDYSNEPVSVP